MKTKKSKRFLGTILAIMMTVSLMPTIAFAGGVQEYEENSQYTTLIGDAKLNVYNTIGGGTISLIDQNAVSTTFPQLTGYRVFKATANTDWIFKGWTYKLMLGNNDLGNPKGLLGYTFTNSRNTQDTQYDGTSDTISINRRVSQGELSWKPLIFTVWANFNPTITASAGDNGSITDEGKIEVSYGDDKAYQITADAGYHIKSVLVDGSEVAGAAGEQDFSYSFNSVKTPHSIVAEFEKDVIPDKAWLSINKVVSGTTTPIPNVVFEVVREDGGPLYVGKDEVKATLTTDADGQIRESGLNPGKLVLTEVGAPTGVSYDSSGTIVLDLVAWDENTINTIENDLEKIDIQVSKSWEDNNNQDNMRPESVTIKLLADGTDTGKTLTLDENNNWTGSFENLLTYNNIADENAIEYTIEEVQVPGYETEITGTVEEGLVVTNTELTEDVEGFKVWEDERTDDERPDTWLELQRTPIMLTAASAYPASQPEWEVVGEPVKVGSTNCLVDDNDSYKHIWENQPIYNKLGQSYFYRIAEVDAEGNAFVPKDYKKLEEGLVVTNTYNPASPVGPGNDDNSKGVKTGDDSNFSLWMALMGLSVIGMGATWTTLAKTRKQKNK